MNSILSGLNSCNPKNIMQYQLQTSLRPLKRH